jgi:protein-tyrosine phosphatase
MASPPKFENILNFRDVGTTINALTNTSTLRPNLLYRSARPDTATPTDRSLLTSHFHIKTIVDLRSKTEHINVAKAHANAASIPPAVPDSESEPKSPCKGRASPSETPVSLTIPTITYNYISLNGPAFERHLLRSLPYFSLFKLVSFMAFDYRDSAIAILGAQVMAPRGLVGLGLDTLDHSTREIKSCFDIFANADSYPVMVHCTQGKDRTGLIILLVLLLCGVGQEPAEADYVLSKKELVPEQEERLKDIRKVGLDESFAGCPAEFVETVIKHLDDRYGGVEKYLTQIGVGEKAQRRIREIMLKPS